jgi:WD40 repeat protein
LSGLPLAARVVEVIADQGEGPHPRYRYGSGCVVAGRTVLTAAHVVKGAVSVKVRDPGKVLHEAMLDPGFVGDVDGPGPDLALVEITGAWTDVPAMGLAAADRDSVSADPVERCHVIGYPAFMERKAPDGSQFRETADAFGRLPVLSGLAGGLLSVQVSSAPRPLPPGQTALGESQWSGMSGAPVVADGLLLGVVTEHAPRQGDSAITATPLTVLDADPSHPGWGPGVANPVEWWARLGGSSSAALRRLPAPPRRAEPAYWATVRDIHQRTTMLVGRQEELAGIASFATGAEGYRWLTGDAWAGKTALLAEAVTVPREEIDVVCYFLSRREADADSSRFLAAVVPQLAYLLEEDPPVAELYQFRALWQRAAQRANAEGRHLLLVADGLDEDLRPPGLPSVAALLPPGAGGRVHVLVSSRPHLELPSDLLPGHPLTHLHPVEVVPFEGGQEQAALARQEIDGLLRRDDDGLATDVLGLLTAAAGPLAVQDLAAMTVMTPRSAALTQRIRRLVTDTAARSLQPAGMAGGDRYQFAHESLLQYAQASKDLNDPDFSDRIHQWADSWKAAGWPPVADGRAGTPRYLLDSYPSTLTQGRLTELFSDVGWIQEAVQSVGVDFVLAGLRRAGAANPAAATVVAILAVVTGQAHYLRPPQATEQPGYALRQLWMQAAESSEDHLADELHHCLQSRLSPGLVPLFTTRRAKYAMSAALGQTGGQLYRVAVLPDGRVVTGGNDGRVLVWDPAAPGAAPAELGRVAHWAGVLAVAVLPDGRLVTGQADGRVLVWDPAAAGAAPAELGRVEDWVRAVAVLPDGRVVTGEEDGRVLVWDPAAAGAAPAELGRAEDWVGAVAVLPDGRLVTGGRDGRVLIWDPAAPGTSPAKLGRHERDQQANRGVNAVAVLPDGRVVTVGDDGRVLVWDPAAAGAAPAELGRVGEWVHAVAVLPDGRVVTGGRDSRVLIWDPAAPGTSLAELGSHERQGPNRGVNALAVLPDGRVVTGGNDGRVLVWDPAALAKLGHRKGSKVNAVAVLPDGRVVTGGDDGRVLVWDPSTPSARPAKLGSHERQGPNRGVNAVAVLPDGRVVTGGRDSRVLIWDPAAPGAAPAKLGRHEGVAAVAVLPDGRVVTGGQEWRHYYEIGKTIASMTGRLLVWDPAAASTRPAKLGRPGWVNAMAVLPDGRVVTAGNDGRVLVWDPAAPGARPAKLGRRRRSAAVRAMAVLPDGRVVTGEYEVVTGEWEGRVLVWDPAAAGAAPGELGSHKGGKVNAVAVLPDGRVVIGEEDGRVLLWEPARPGTGIIQLNCSVTALAAAPPGPTVSCLVIAHEGTGFSVWSVAM